MEAAPATSGVVIIRPRETPRSQLLAVFAKRTYALTEGVLSPASTQLSLRTTPELSPTGDVVRDSDMIVGRRMADVIIEGHTYSPGESAWDAEIVVGDLRRRVVVQGERRVTADASGRPVFSRPQHAARVALSWENAYGGCDLLAARVLPDPIAEAIERTGLPYNRALGRCSYPRNPLGKGYVIATPGARSYEEVSLPSLEWPGSVVTPETLVRSSALAWPEWVPPAGLGWLPYGFFPRSFLAGFPAQIYDRDRGVEQFLEVRTGVFPASVFGTVRLGTADAGFANSSAVGMRAESVAADAALRLTNLHPRHRVLSARLPGEKPRVVVRVDKSEVQEPTPSIQSVILEPDLDRVSVVWSATCRVERALLREEQVEHAVLWS